MSTFRTDPDGTRLPIKLDSTSNGEFEPIPLSATNRAANSKLAQEHVTVNARRTGLTRRGFLMSSCGAATTLLAFNRANAAAGQTGASSMSPPKRHWTRIAAASVEGDEFIFDVQGHFVDPNGDWVRGVPSDARPFSWAQKAGCALGNEPSERSYLRRLGPRSS